EGREARTKLVVAAREQRGALRFRLDDAIGVVVPVIVVRGAGAARRGGQELHAARAVGGEEKRACGGGQRGRHTGRARAGEAGDIAEGVGRGDRAKEVVAVGRRGGTQVERGVRRDVPRRRGAV